MSDTYMNWTSRVAIAGRVAERRRLSFSSNDLAIQGDYHLPFGKTEARAEALKWFWKA
jgi:hypothetical protein